jgi:hypothetical protein
MQMKLLFQVCILSSLTLRGSPLTSDQNWRQLVPLKSTRAEVEQVLGPTKEAYYAIYKLKEGNLFIEYSSGPCRPERKGGWNVPLDTVVHVSFTPNQKKRLSALKLDPKKFRKVVSHHAAGIFYYVNDEEGIVYQVQEGKVDSVEYGPTKKEKHLHCGYSPEQRPF